MKVNSRYIGALVLAPLLIFVLLGGLPLKLFTIALSVCGLYEFYHALSTKEIKSIPIISYALLIAYYLLNNNFESMMYILVIAMVLSLIIPIIDLKYSFKTIEGSIGGFLGGTLGCGIFGIVVSSYVPEVSVIHFFLIGALCGIMGQFGDLVASSIKRYVGLKDYSNLIPGHGGILDRFDSILFNAVVVFYYLTFILRI